MLSSVHVRILTEATEKLCGAAAAGQVVYVRCLKPDTAHELAVSRSFAPAGWSVYCVADSKDAGPRVISADMAVERREAKTEALLLLVDTTAAGAGMDGIYSAGRELSEHELFDEACRLARQIASKRISREDIDLAKRAVQHAAGRRTGRVLSRWAEFDFYVRIAETGEHPGRFFYLLGLWPVSSDAGLDPKAAVELSKHLVDILLGEVGAGLPPTQRIAALHLLSPTQAQRNALERFADSAFKEPLITALAALADQEQLWLGNLRVEEMAGTIAALEIIPWRGARGLLQWSGLRRGQSRDDPPIFYLPEDGGRGRDLPAIEVRWRARPQNLPRGAAVYQVTVLSDQEEELAEQTIEHAARAYEKCRFSVDDFSALLDESAVVTARIRVAVLGQEGTEPTTQESEEFVIRCGEAPEGAQSVAGKKVRTFSEAFVSQLGERQEVTEFAKGFQEAAHLYVDNRGYLGARIGLEAGARRFRVAMPKLLEEIAEAWPAQLDKVGRWQVKVRESGLQAGPVQYIPWVAETCLAAGECEQYAQGLRKSAGRLAELFKAWRGVGYVYDVGLRSQHELVREYLNAWVEVLRACASRDPCVVLSNTVEVQSMSGRIVGLIVLPQHPLRVAWHSAYDNLLFHGRYEENIGPAALIDEMQILDGSLFPAFLPGLNDSYSFVFGDMLGFHAVGMVRDNDPEPKAALALLSRLIGGANADDVEPTAGIRSSDAIAREITKYLECHGLRTQTQDEVPPSLAVRALRVGDGYTVVKALSRVADWLALPEQEQPTDSSASTLPLVFKLDLLPSAAREYICGRYIAEMSERRRRGAGQRSDDDLRLLESIETPQGVSIPRLRWARRDPNGSANAPAHLALAFDTFVSRVGSEQSVEPVQNGDRPLPYPAFGLLSHYERRFNASPFPHWTSRIPRPGVGEKHPAAGSLTERLVEMQHLVHSCTSSQVPRPSAGLAEPVLFTELDSDKVEDLRSLHAQCDWVVTVDRNAGIEYFDSPHDNPCAYEAYVIDCVPERNDMGALQLITSTTRLDEVQTLVDQVLDQLDLSRSRRNAEFVLDNLKALSGRLAMRLTGTQAASAELLALALARRACDDASRSPATTDCWVSLNDGFLVPVDDIQDLLPFGLSSSSGTANSGKSEEAEIVHARPDLIYVTRQGRRRHLTFSFIEVKYRRHLATARSADLLDQIASQTRTFRARWTGWYCDPGVGAVRRGVRLAQLARILGFYLDKAQRHGMPQQAYAALSDELKAMVEEASDYDFAENARPDLGWVFCPEFAGAKPEGILARGADLAVYLFGAGLLPDAAGLRSGWDAEDNEAPAQTFGSRSLRAEVKEVVEIERGTVGPAAPVSEISHQVDMNVGAESGGIQVNVPASWSSRIAGEATSTAAGVPSGSLETGTAEVGIVLGRDHAGESDVTWRVSIDGNPHLLVCGLPGMGKTTCLLNISDQMTRTGIHPIVFSYHPDFDERFLQLNPDVRFVDCDYLGFNPLAVHDRSNPSAYLDVAGSIRDIFRAIFPELGELQTAAIRDAVKKAFEEKGWMASSPSSGLEEPAFCRFYEILRSQARDARTQTLVTRLSELADYGLFNVREEGYSLLDTTKTVIVRLHWSVNEHVQSAFASFVLYNIYKEMFLRGPQARLTHAVVFDEAHKAARLSLIPIMAKECRKFGISFILASQEAKDFNTSVFSAIANYLILRVNEADARSLAKNVASSDVEKRLIDRMKQLDRFNALFVAEGRRRAVPVRLAAV